MIIVIESFVIPIARVCLFFLSILWAVRFFRGVLSEKARFLVGLRRRASRKPQDLVFIFFMPAFAYVAFVEGTILAGIVCAIVALYMMISLLWDSLKWERSASVHRTRAQKHSEVIQQ